MWIRIDDVICKADDFARFYIEMNSGEYGIIGKESNNRITIFVNYRSYSKAKEVLDNLYKALERGDRAFTIPNRMY
jgi:hypothetical protein